MVHLDNGIHFRMRRSTAVQYYLTLDLASFSSELLFVPSTPFRVVVSPPSVAVSSSNPFLGRHAGLIIVLEAGRSTRRSGTGIIAMGMYKNDVVWGQT